MTENEAIKEIQLNILLPFGSNVSKEASELAIQALEIVKKLSERKMTIDVLENYMQFEDECVKKGFTLKSVIEAREKQIPKKPINKTKPDDYASLAYENCNIIVCPTCGGRLKLKSKGRYCDKCGQRLDWSGNYDK